jgi:hypothetical protein
LQLIATGFWPVVKYFESSATATGNCRQPHATATDGPVAYGWVRLGPGLFSGCATGLLSTNIAIILRINFNFIYFAFIAYYQRKSIFLLS